MDTEYFPEGYAKRVATVIHDIYVLPEYRRGGIGRMLINEVIKCSKSERVILQFMQIIETQ